MRPLERNRIKISEVIVGVDTHLDVHVGALVNATGKCLGTLSVTTDTAGYLKLMTWAGSFGSLHRAGVEGTGTYGAGLARTLRDHGVGVLEVNRPDGPCVDPEENPMLQMPRTLRARFYLARQRLFRSSSLGLQKPCVRSPLPGVARSRLRLRQSTSCAPY